jgi:hypothetical protein
MAKLIRTNDIEYMKPITTKSGFKQISKDSFHSQHDPRLTLLNFRSQDIKHVIPIRVSFLTKDGKLYLLDSVH